ncbi:Activator of Hsp90 ATPase 1 family protein [Mesorhizobium opportunistum WSM2075]|uniref:Activator of Hsp90 ATPase 1 family protein n=2 Tax=Mesorhizobium opportunistum TaxID=593909 RepID=F7YB33_MESOW|nr:Activator of Hsp90 ATPase 1 family protein [Mesorhizobium opportunistum WSM2075]
MTYVPMVHSMTNGETIMASADLGAPVEHVFHALVSDEVERWWGSADTYRVVDWSADLRVGGRWTVVVRTADGRSRPAGGEFLDIEAPRRIVQTRAYAWDHPTLGRRETKVAYLLEPIAIGTRITICHGGFAGLSEAAAEHAEGWGRVLSWLQAYLDAGNRVAAWTRLFPSPPAGEGGSARQRRDR